MTFFAVDDEPLLLKMLVAALREAEPDAEVTAFRTAAALLTALRTESPDVVFTDIEMPGMNGLALAEEIVKIAPKTNIVFVTGFPQYGVDAFRLYASGYLLKPVDAKSVRETLDNLRYPITKNKEIRVKTFGNFSVFVHGEPVRFRLSKSVELLAYLVDREGAPVSKAEVGGVLYEDDYSRSVQAELTRAVRWLEEDLTAAGAEKILRRESGRYSVDPHEFSCDLYDYLQKKEGVSYTGEYMEQFSFGEYRKSSLLHRK